MLGPTLRAESGSTRAVARRRPTGAGMFWRTIVPSAGLLVALLGSTTPVAAHETALAAGQDDDQVNEARELTETLRQGLLGGSKSQAAREALIRSAQRRHDLLSKIAARDPGRVLDLALQPNERSALPDAVRPLIKEWSARGRAAGLAHDQEDGRSEYDVRLMRVGRETRLRFGSPAERGEAGRPG